MRRIGQIFGGMIRKLVSYQFRRQSLRSFSLLLHNLPQMRMEQQSSEQHEIQCENQAEQSIEYGVYSPAPSWRENFLDLF